MKKIPLLLLLLLLVSCQKVYHEFNRDFPDFKWTQNDAKTYSFSISEAAGYDLIIELSHFYDYPFTDLPLLVSITDPNGSTTQFKSVLQIRDKDGKPLGDCAMDICDLNFNIKNGVNLTRGDYKIVISNDFNAPHLPGIIGVGLTVNHST